MGVDREDSGAMPDTSTIPTKHIKGVFCGGDIGSIHIEIISERIGVVPLNDQKIVNGEYNNYALVFFFNKENYAMAA